MRQIDKLKSKLTNLGILNYETEKNESVEWRSETGDELIITVKDNGDLIYSYIIKNSTGYGSVIFKEEVPELMIKLIKEIK